MGFSQKNLRTSDVVNCLPVRNEYIEKIQTQVSETNGKLVNLKGGNTMVTHHFKRQ